MKLYCGIDAGASAVKVVLIDSVKRICGFAVQKSGIDFRSTSEDCLARALSQNSVPRDKISVTVATGYGRNSVENADIRKTEISCHCKAAWHFFPHRATIVDIGGQDSKIIHMDESGRLTDFKMNRKCAAGTGAFLEEISLHLGVPIEKMMEKASGAIKKLTLGSFCTVFTKTEILTLIKNGEKLEEILRAVYDSVAKRVIEMDRLEGNVVMTGGVVQYHPILVELLREKTNAEFFVPEKPQIAGALGAALFALEMDSVK